MKLYVYDHCPFCVRARMPFGLKDIPVELIFVPNDDEETPISMIGKKMLPILEDADGYLGESLDIVHKVDAMKESRLFDGQPGDEITGWIDEWSDRINDLVIPRTPVSAYPEFATPEARAYFTLKKEEQFGKFDELLAKTDAVKAELEKGLVDLARIAPDPDAPGIDDILLFPKLRSLSVVPGLSLPPKLATYRDRMSRQTGIPLFPQLETAAS